MATGVLFLVPGGIAAAGGLAMSEGGSNSYNSGSVILSKLHRRAITDTVPYAQVDDWIPNGSSRNRNHHRTVLRIVPRLLSRHEETWRRTRLRILGSSRVAVGEEGMWQTLLLVRISSARSTLLFPLSSGAPAPTCT